MDRKLKTIGYVMIPRDLLLKAFDEHPEAGGDMDAFLRILTYVNYAEAVVKRESREVLCARGESVISYSQWAEILGWSLGRTRRCFIRLITNGSIELVKGDCASHIRIPAYDVWTGKRKNGQQLILPLKNLSDCFGMNIMKPLVCLAKIGREHSGSGNDYHRRRERWPWKISTTISSTYGIRSTAGRR